MEHATLQLMDSILTSLLQLGGPGIALAVTVYFFNKQSDQHRGERLEHRTDMKNVTDKFDTSLKENTQALSQLQATIETNKCRV
jgi:hypothetical protein